MFHVAKDGRNRSLVLNLGKRNLVGAECQEIVTHLAYGPINHSRSVVKRVTMFRRSAPTWVLFIMGLTRVVDVFVRLYLKRCFYIYLISTILFSFIPNFWELCAHSCADQYYSTVGFGSKLGILCTKWHVISWDREFKQLFDGITSPFMFFGLIFLQAVFLTFVF